ncbi:uncharacterized protein LOC120697970 [Panicum virgatum]|uniref:Uncharacterized protein n=1 Tax=Panicum virgatum TaxID=38727 RepID=A0A8T0UUZ8_PANVG|nr:uncharacterized protein LOC120697970 [Panicum virgatum]KAG2626077.1 hypothetical protein PVAP13_3KG285300 [Panicum virgatum]
MPKLRSIFTVLILTLLLLVSVSSGQTATKEGNHEYSLEVAEFASLQSQMQRHGRRVLTDLQDYDYGGSNPKHDPRKKPGNGHSR